jgi:hypothetical protein
LQPAPDKLAAIKRKLEDNRLIPCAIPRLFTKHIEAAYTAMFERHRDGLPPEHIAVSARARIAIDRLIAMLYFYQPSLSTSQIRSTSAIDIFVCSGSTR